MAKSSASTRFTGRRGPSWKLIYLVLAALWLLVLYGFTATVAWIWLSVLGAGLALGGIALSAGALPDLRDGLQYLGVFVLGLLLLGAALLTLLPGLPGSWLTSIAPSWDVLENRKSLLEQAIEQGDRPLAVRLATRGLGDASPRDSHGRPLLFDVEGADLIRELVAAGLSPNAVDEEGRTLLMLTDDADLAAALLAAGADPNARDLEGRTPLTYAYRKDPRHVGLLLEAGADVHAVDNAGIAVADLYPAAGLLRDLLEEYAGDSSLPPPRPFEAVDRGRRDWLVTRDPAAPISPSAISIDPEELRYGDLATIDIRLSNDSEQDRLLDVRAKLGGAAFFVAASHEGRIENPYDPGVSQTIRWPRLALPAKSEGRLSLEIVTDWEERAGDLTVDLRYRSPGETEDEVLTLHKTPVFGEIIPVIDWWGILGALVVVVGMILAVRYLLRMRKTGTEKLILGVTSAAAVACGVAFVTEIAGMVEPWTSFEETSCEILDRRIGLSTWTTSTTGARGQSSSTSTIVARPVVAVRFAAQGREWTRVGFATGGGFHPVHELALVPLGAEVPCWFDPDDPTRFTVVRTPGARGLLFLIMLAVSGVALFLAARSFRFR
jgi:hypothetical protein